MATRWARSRAGAPGQVVLQLRMVGGQLQVSAAQNRGGARFTGCLEQTMANVVLRTAQQSGRGLPYNTGFVTVNVTLSQGTTQPVPTTPAYPPQPVPTPTPQYATVFQEQGRFTVRNVRLEGQGPAITVASGGVIRGTMEVQHNCPGCGGAINSSICPTRSRFEVAISRCPPSRMPLGCRSLRRRCLLPRRSQAKR